MKKHLLSVTPLPSEDHSKSWFLLWLWLMVWDPLGAHRAPPWALGKPHRNYFRDVCIFFYWYIISQKHLAWWGEYIQLSPLSGGGSATDLWFFALSFENLNQYKLNFKVYTEIRSWSNFNPLPSLELGLVGKQVFLAPSFSTHFIY